MTDRELEAIHQVMHRLERRWNVLPIPDATIRHAYDPLPVALFLAGLRAASAATEGRRFLDVGCGVGRNLALAYALGWQVAGVERHGPYSEAARELLPEAAVTVTVADAFDVEGFDADVVYLYRPMRSDADQDALERHVIYGMTAGSLLFLPLRSPALSLPLERVADEIWRRV